jgi:hypothetical protein
MISDDLIRVGALERMRVLAGVSSIKKAKKIVATSMRRNEKLPR